MSVLSTSKTRKNIILMVIMGLVYLLIELFMRIVNQEMIGFQVGLDMKHSVFSLAGWTSLWMLPIGGLCGLFMGYLNEWEWLVKRPVTIQAFIGGIVTAGIELVSGIILNNWLQLGIWDYHNKAFHILGQVCLENTILFIVCAGPFAFWIDDVLRFLLFGEERIYSLWDSYKRFFTFKKQTLVEFPT